MGNLTISNKCVTYGQKSLTQSKGKPDFLEFRSSIEMVCFSFGHVMQSSKISLNSNKIKSYFYITLFSSFLELRFAVNPIKIELTVPEK